jgi:dihydroorotase-like cyclic amidohydrolase
VRERRKLAEIYRCNTVLHGCVVAWDKTVEGQFEMAELGVRTIKLFTTYRDVVMVEPDTVLEVLRALHRQGGIASLRARCSQHVIEDSQTAEAGVHRSDARHHAGTCPERTEAAAVAEALTTAEHVGAPVYFVHQTAAAAVDLVRATVLVSRGFDVASSLTYTTVINIGGLVGPCWPAFSVTGSSAGSSWATARRWRCSPDRVRGTSSELALSSSWVAYCS